ncbi:hypothetical protein OSTOST_10544, partial [Ostertagia ostertagi]
MGVCGAVEVITNVLRSPAAEFILDSALHFTVQFEFFDSNGCLFIINASAFHDDQQQYNPSQEFNYNTVFILSEQTVLHYDVTTTGFTTALPYILSAALKFIVGPISDRATCISDRWRLVFFAAASQGLMALSFLALV